MKPLSKKYVYSGATVIAVFLIGVSYNSFSQYSPNIQPIQQVKGATVTQDSLLNQIGSTIPFPVNSQVLSTNQSETNTIVTLETNLSVQRVRDFYVNALESTNWTLDKNSDENDVFEKIWYKKDGSKINITFTPESIDNTESTNTIVVVELQNISTII